MSTFDAPLRHHAGEVTRERYTRDPGTDRGLFVRETS
jgi:hypothetical protein